MQTLTTAEKVTISGFNSGALKRMNAPLLPIYVRVKNANKNQHCNH